MKKMKTLVPLALLATGFLVIAAAQTFPGSGSNATKPGPGYSFGTYEPDVLAQTQPKPVPPGPAPGIAPAPAPTHGHGAACGTSCGHGCADCNIVCLKPWKCEDLEMKPVEHKPHGCTGCGWLDSLLWCPKEEAKNGNGNGNGEEAKGPDTPLMQAIQCLHPDLYQHLDCNGTKVYGWIQAGYTYNFDGPNRGSAFGLPSSFFGPNFNNRHNDGMLNQVWLRFENTLEHNGEFNIGYTIDANFGQDAADFNVISLGMWENFTGDADLAIADDEDYGMDLPQFFVEAHIPGFITEKGMDIRVGRFLTLHGNELSPAIQTRFYSHSYGYFYAWPLTHTGVMTTLHLSDTLDLMNGLVMGWDNVFSDNNDVPSWHGMLMWTACDKNSTAFVTWMVGPEGVGRFDSRNDTYRVLVTADYTRKFGCYNEWELALHGGSAWDDSIFTGQEVEWYDYAANLFYTVNPKLILGTRAEWFRDDDGYRIGVADSFYEVTAGFTYKPYQNLWIRPEVRVDWANDTKPFNDGKDGEMFTIAADVIWQF